MSQLIVNPHMASLRSLMSNSIVYEVPTFQRNYSWSEEEWNDLWEDLMALPNNDSEQHYMGYIVLQKKSSRQYLIVDGQQRIATLSILILAAAKCIKDETHRDKLLESYLLPESVTKLVPQSRLKLNKTNNNFYANHLLKLKRPVSMQRQHLSNRKMWSAFEYFVNKIEKKFGGNEDAKIAEFIDMKTGEGLIFTVLNVENEEAAFTVFETLNARGVELSSPDLLKNRLFSVVYAEDRSDETLERLESLWDDMQLLVSENMTKFLRYLELENADAVRKSNLYRAVREEFRRQRDF